MRTARRVFVTLQVIGLATMITMASPLAGATTFQEAGASHVPTAGTAAGAPVASFTWSPGSVSANQVVQFKDTSTGDPASWSWVFGDGATSSQQSPTHTFATCGVYPVTLTVANATGSSAVTKPVTVTAAACLCTATRTLPSGYVAGQPIRVTIQAVPPEGTVSYLVEETPPSGWPVAAVDNGGSFEVTTGKVKWGPFSGGHARTFHYTVTPPAGTTQTRSFAGTIAINGASQQICGATALGPGQYHPADSNGDWRIIADEMLAYSWAWKSGTSWAQPPDPIPADHVSNAGMIWKKGEAYHHDAGATPPWVAGAGSEADTPRLESRRAQRAALVPGTAIASFGANSYTPGVGVKVTIQVTPASEIVAWVVEDAPPVGWTVSAIDADGAYDAVNGKVKWGLFFDSQARTLSYLATPPAGETGSKSFSGLASLDGANVTIGGARGISPYANSVWVPVASHASGLNSSLWRTDLGVFNPNSAPAGYEVRFYSGGKVASSTASVVAGGQAILGDVVGQLKTSGSGAIEVRSDLPVRVSSRTYNVLASGAPCFANGTLGQDFPSFAATQGLAAGDHAWLTQLIESELYRTNIGLTNTSAGTATVEVELFDGAGGMLASYAVTLAAGEWKQESRPFHVRAGQTTMTRGSAKVTVTAGSGVLAYASVVDNITNDPTTMWMMR